MDGTYAPQSPDLSSFLSSPSKKQLQPLQPRQPHQAASQSSSYAPRSPVIPDFTTQPPPQHPAVYYDGNQQSGNEFGNNQYMPPIPALPPSHSFGGPSTSSPYLSNPSHPVQSEGSYRGTRNTYDDTDADADAHYIPSPTMSSRPSRNPRGGGEQLGSPSFISNFPQTHPQQQIQPHHHRNPNPNNIEIRTKFPVARIKRIMQADEEVGKVAQVTPVAVSKALELFMISLVSGAAAIAREKGGKRVTAQHLKQVVEGDDQFDFLGEIVGRVAETTEGAGGEGRKRKGENKESDSEEEEKKPKKGKGRRKKSSDD